ncbi:20948_t:CDS:1, partial [Rhizophagus irregularis]
EYTNDYDISEIWWPTCQQLDNYIQKLVLKIFAITSYQPVCE